MSIKRYGNECGKFNLAAFKRAFGTNALGNKDWEDLFLKFQNLPEENKKSAGEALSAIYLLSRPSGTSEGDPSFFNTEDDFYRKAIKFARENDIIKYGAYKENYEGSKDIWCYERWWRGDRIFVVASFRDWNVKFRLPGDAVYASSELVLHNYGCDRPKLTGCVLRPFECLVYFLK
jgi:hypothetical protein